MDHVLQRQKTTPLLLIHNFAKFQAVRSLDKVIEEQSISTTIYSDTKKAAIAEK